MSRTAVDPLRSETRHNTHSRQAAPKQAAPQQQASPRQFRDYVRQIAAGTGACSVASNLLTDTSSPLWDEDLDLVAVRNYAAAMGLLRAWDMLVSGWQRKK
jgi:hypothetical protein